MTITTATHRATLAHIHACQALARAKATSAGLLELTYIADVDLAAAKATVSTTELELERYCVVVPLNNDHS